MSEKFPKLRKGDIIHDFYTMLSDVDLWNGRLSIPPALSIDGAGEMTAYSMAFFGPDAPRLTYLTMAKAMSERPTELIFGMDRYAKPGQAIELEDFVSIHYFDGRGWRFGVAEYDLKKRFVKPIDWSNPFWTPLLKNELLANFGPSGIHKSNTPIVLPPRGKRPEGFVGTRPDRTDQPPDAFSRAFPGWPMLDQRESTDADEWLEIELRQRGADDATVDKLLYAAGQHVAMTDDPWGENQRQLERFIAGEIEQPGDELAQTIMDAALPYFQNMYGPMKIPSPAEQQRMRDRLAEIRKEGFP